MSCRYLWQVVSCLVTTTRNFLNSNYLQGFVLCCFVFTKSPTSCYNISCLKMTQVTDLITSDTYSRSHHHSVGSTVAKKCYGLLAFNHFYFLSWIFYKFSPVFTPLLYIPGVILILLLQKGKLFKWRLMISSGWWMLMAILVYSLDWRVWRWFKKYRFSKC